MPITGRSLAVAVAQRDQLARDGVRLEVGPGELDQPLERRDRVAARAKVERDEVGLAARQHRDRRRLVAEMAAVVKLGQRRLDGAVAAVDRQHLRPDPGDRPSSPRRSGRRARPHNGRCRGARRNIRGCAAAGRCCRSTSGWTARRCAAAAGARPPVLAGAGHSCPSGAVGVGRRQQFRHEYPRPVRYRDSIERSPPGIRMQSVRYAISAAFAAK